MRDLVDPARVVEGEQGKDRKVMKGLDVETDPEAAVDHSSANPGLEKDLEVMKESSVERGLEAAADHGAQGQDTPTTESLEAQGTTGKLGLPSQRIEKDIKIGEALK